MAAVSQISVWRRYPLYNDEGFDMARILTVFLGRAAGCGALLAVAAARAQTADLVDHDGFDVCWSRALTKPDFLALIESSIDSATPGCVPSGVVNGTPYCSETTCADNLPGCPVKVHAGTFEELQLQIASGYGSFGTTSGSVDGFSMPVTVPIVGDCILTFTNVTPASLVYALQYPLRSDGLAGFYTTGLPTVGAVTVNGLTGSDFALTGGFGCAVASVGVGFFAASLQSILQDQLLASISETTAATVGQSVCPANSNP